MKTKKNPAVGNVVDPGANVIGEKFHQIARDVDETPSNETATDQPVRNHGIASISTSIEI
jgi:hypothetical protein